MKITKKEKEQLRLRVLNIREMIKATPERHPSTIIATTGSTFYNDLIILYEYCIQEKQDDIRDILLKYTQAAKNFQVK